MTSGIVFDIQTACIYDGPGVRTCVFFKGCPLRCAWCHNPESWNAEPEIGYLAERCAACGACMEVCPQKAIALDDSRVMRDAGRCVVCGECAAVCPTEATEGIGREMTAGEVVEIALRDKPFYEGTGGGVTFTGGEATGQPGFLLDVAERLREAGVHVALETCGVFPDSLTDRLAQSIDLFLFDLKCVDPEAHRKWTGVKSEPVLNRFCEVLIRVGTGRILPRIPVVPGVNADGESIDAIAAFLAEARYSGEVYLMPYNRLAKSKWEKVGRGDFYRDMGEVTDGLLSRLSERLAAAGFRPVVSE